VSREATILHADVDAFFASVEQRDDPRLRGRPVIVGAGVVLAASYEAKAYGVCTAMGGAQARRLCPLAVVVEPRMSAYAEASKAVYRVLEDTTPLVEGLSIDEAFLDVRGLERISARPPRSPSGCGVRSSSKSVYPSRWGWPGRSSWPRWQAA
jgi:DNA polymerase-4